MIRIYCCKCRCTPTLYEREFLNRTLYRMTCSECQIDIYAFSIDKVKLKWNKKIKKYWWETPLNDWIDWED